MPPGYTPKLLLVTKLTAILLFAAFMQVSAGTYAQKINIKEKDVKITDIFKKITKQTGYYFIYNKELIEKSPVVSIKVANAGILETLDKLFSGLNLAYEITDKGIAVIEKKSSGSSPEEQKTAFDNIDVHGRVIDENGKGLAGAVIKLKDGRRTTVTNADGEFTFLGVDEKATIIISFLGFKVQEIKVSKQLGNIQLEPVAGQLNEVGVVSTGYQTIPKERATGSFTQVDNALINRSVSTSILDRLKDVTSGLNFSTSNNLGAYRRAPIEIRGRSTLFADPNPLIVLDNFPYDGDLNNINPNDIESITVLKDATAASAWGTKSSNGVIVITTKKGSLNSATKIGLTSNIAIGGKPDLYYSPQLSSEQYIGVQRFLFDKGAYNGIINNGYAALPSAVELFRNPSDPNYETKLNALKSFDIRNQLEKYFYRPSVNQQYQLNINGGSVSQKYYVSAGYDKNLSNLVGNAYDRITLNTSNTYYMLNNRLELFSNLIYTSSNNRSLPGFNPTNPYDQIADENGTALPVANILRPSYAQTAGNGRLLNWIYKPLDELNQQYGSTNNNLTDYRLNLSLSYKVIEDLKASALYTYEKGISNSNQLYELESFYTRNLINQFSQVNLGTGVVTYPLPPGAIYTDYNSTIKSQNGRFQLNYNKAWGKNTVDAIGGTEVRESRTDIIFNQFFGYNEETKTNQNAAINYTANYPLFYGGSPQRINPNTGSRGNLNRFLSNYINLAYSYDDQYIASFSARQDESNLFGVASNQKGVPLWSAGVAWIINKESFYNLNWLRQLKLRGTFGYTGNVDNTLSAYLTTSTLSNQINLYNALYSVVINPPNPSLRWEKVQNINLAIDFSTKADRINGSIDFWQKKGNDLIGNSPIAPQTGIVLYRGNSANTVTNGIDIQINSINLNRVFKWYTTALYNYTASKVISYKVSNGTNLNVVASNFNNPLEGYPYFALFSFKYAGLNATGDPQGYLNGEISTNYNAISNSTDRAELKYNGSAIPTSFGSLRNTFIYKNLDFSFNIAYKLGYYFRRNSLNNSSLYSTANSFGYADYENRWQKAGDESYTNVPALVYPANQQRTNLYTYSDALVEKADNIRLQDLRIGYSLTRAKQYFRSINLFVYMSNLGILWCANKRNIDPDYPTGLPMARSIAFGIRADF